MNIDLSDDQRLFLDSADRFIRAALPLDLVRAGIQSNDVLKEKYRLQAAELGWFGLLCPEELGGGSVSGNGVTDAALIAQALGANLQPLSFAESSVVVYSVATAGSAEQQATVLPRLVTGEESATWASDAWAAGDPAAGVTAVPQQDGTFLLHGTVGYVSGADSADWLLVTSNTGSGRRQFLVPRLAPGLAVKRLDALDLTRALCEVKFAEVVLPQTSVVGDAVNGAQLAERQLQIACVLTTADLVGAMETDFALALAYAKDRIAFGRPIGSFQAIKHLLADISLLFEMSQAAATAAARAVGNGTDDAGIIASMAKSYVGESGVTLSQACFQVFGGVGYTWEHDQHLYLRRIASDAGRYGDAIWHRERICQLGNLVQVRA